MTVQPADYEEQFWMARSDSTRLLWLDMARTAALFGMVVFHFVRDLEMFALIAPGTTVDGFWAAFARFIAGSFLFLSGVSLVVAHGEGFRPCAWAKRFAALTGAALLISVATRLAMPEVWIQFGILHAIAAASVVGLIFLRVPALGTVAAALLVLWLSEAFGRSLDFPGWMAWTGLGATVPKSLDFIPLVPWLVPFLLGMALAQAIDLSRLEPSWIAPPLRIVTLPGQHSLLVYLVHQPILISVLAALSWVLR